MRITTLSRILVTGVTLGVLLSGSVAAQPAPYYQPYPPPGAVPPPGYPAPPPPGYAAPGYEPPGYAAPPAYPSGTYIGPDGLTYLNGVPVYYAYGSYLPLVFIAGFGWGYYGPGHHWFGAPPGLLGRLNHAYPGGRGFPGGFHGGHPGFRGGDHHDDRR